MPPKNMISVARNNHMPNDEAWRCCSMSAKWCWSAELCCATVMGLSANTTLLGGGDVLVVVSFPIDHRGTLKIESRWRRRRLPLQPGRAPGIGGGKFTVAHRPQEIDHGQQVTHGKDGRAGRRKHVQHLELRRILPVTARHAEIAQDELREERQVEADEDNQRRQPA